MALVLAACGGTQATEPAPTASNPTSLPAPTAQPEPEPEREPEPTATQVPVPPLAMNHVQVLGSHNSYHLRPPQAIFDVLVALAPDLAKSRDYAHRALTEQLDTFGIRQLELDVYADPDGGLYSNPAVNLLVGLPALDDPLLAAPGFKVLHIQDYDYATTCLTLVLCLDEVAEWSTANPNHVPLVIMVEFKSESVPESAEDEGVELPALAWTTPLGPTAALLDDLDAEIRSVFEPAQVITPDQVRNDAATLEQAITTSGWPSLADSRGKVMFVLIGSAELRDLYRAEAPSLQGRTMFTNSSPGEADAAFVLIDDPSDSRIEQAVQAGYLVRTRTDTPTTNARTNDRTRLDAATTSGAHFLSTDYYLPSEFFDSPYLAALPGDLIARCNPIAAPPTCTDDQLTE